MIRGEDRFVRMGNLVPSAASAFPITPVDSGLPPHPSWIWIWTTLINGRSSMAVVDPHSGAENPGVVNPTESFNARLWGRKEREWKTMQSPGEITVKQEFFFSFFILLAYRIINVIDSVIRWNRCDILLLYRLIKVKFLLKWHQLEFRKTKTIPTFSCTNNVLVSVIAANILQGEQAIFFFYKIQLDWTV